MPYIDIRLAATPLVPEQKNALFAGITDLMATLMGKQREVTAVSIREHAEQDWAVGGSALGRESAPGAYVAIKVTQGTNSTREKAAMIAATTALLKEVLGEIQCASYVVIDEIAADAWGYDGRTQEQRKSVPARDSTPQTLRRMSGVLPPASLDPARSALVLIDFQMEYFTGALPVPDAEHVAKVAQRLLDWADECHMPVMHVQHVNTQNSAVFPAGSSCVAFHPRLEPRPGHEQMVKKLPSAFVASGLDDWLKSGEIETLLLCGLMTHTCISSTARDALSLGYRAIVLGDGCATRDLPDPADGTVPHAEVQRASLAALADRFADVMDSAALMALPLAP